MLQVFCTFAAQADVLLRTLCSHVTRLDPHCCCAQEKFGVEKPSKFYTSERATVMGYGPGGVHKGTTGPYTPALILPKKYRHDPYAVVPSEFADVELEKVGH